eukprot:gene42039-7424_t
MITRAPAAIPHQLVPDPDSGRKTLHFTNLPRIDEADFRDWLQDNFSSEDVIAHRFSAGDSRPPVAWVLFANSDLARHWLDQYNGKSWAGSRLRVEMARRELEPDKLHDTAAHRRIRLAAVRPQAPRRPDVL